tara:strand:+ start:643 stop:891 length:249 start_codon:yes stop_codon:yes gene_type:complete
MKLPIYKYVLECYLLDCGYNWSVQLTNQEHRHVAIEYGKQLLDYAAQEAELETVYENPVNPSMGSFEIVNKESITNIKKQIK